MHTFQIALGAVLVFSIIFSTCHFLIKFLWCGDDLAEIGNAQAYLYTIFGYTCIIVAIILFFVSAIWAFIEWMIHFTTH